MMFTRIAAIVSLVGVGLQAMSGWASVDIDVDGALLDDWGVTIVTGAAATGSPGNDLNGGGPSTNPYGGSMYSAVPSHPGVATATTIEDTNDNKNGYFLGPDGGGQGYDVEFMGVGISSDYLYIAIMTGQRPDNGFSTYSPGDIQIVTDSGLFGLEVGGGWGTGVTGSQVSDVEKGDYGATYDITGSGYTEGVMTSELSTSHENITVGTINSIAASMDPDQEAGSLWATDSDDWITETVGSGNSQVQFQFLSGSPVDDSSDPIEYFYNLSDSGEHAVIEAKINLDYFGGATVTSINWSPSCGNDTLSVDVPVPEMASIMIWSGLALVGLVAGKRRAK